MEGNPTEGGNNEGGPTTMSVEFSFLFDDVAVPRQGAIYFRDLPLTSLSIIADAFGGARFSVENSGVTLSYLHGVLRGFVVGGLETGADSLSLAEPNDDWAAFFGRGLSPLGVPTDMIVPRILQVMTTTSPYSRDLLPRGDFTITTVFVPDAGPTVPMMFLGVGALLLFRGRF
jgi:hypothetical protein